MNERSLLATGIAGTVVAALCCFTPVLAVLLAALGLSAWLGWVDWVLLPALAAFACVTVYATGALWRRRRQRASAPPARGRRT